MRIVKRHPDGTAVRVWDCFAKAWLPGVIVCEAGHSPPQKPLYRVMVEGDGEARRNVGRPNPDLYYHDEVEVTSENGGTK